MHHISKSNFTKYMPCNNHKNRNTKYFEIFTNIISQSLLKFIGTFFFQRLIFGTPKVKESVRAMAFTILERVPICYADLTCNVLNYNTHIYIYIYIWMNELVRLNLINHFVGFIPCQFACNSAFKNHVFRRDLCEGNVWEGVKKSLRVCT